MIVLALLLALAVPAHAGDPCPIGLYASEYTPSWRDRTADLAALKSQRRWLGVSYALRDGQVRVTKVMPGSPAAQAGLSEGDRLVSLGGTPLSDVASTSALLDAAPPDAVIALVVARDGVERAVSLARGPADPVFLGLVNAAEGTECRTVEVRGLTEAQRGALGAGAFDAQRGFRCEDAHTALTGSFESGSVVFIRGGSRILLTMPGWRTTCVGVDATDGEALTPARLSGILEELTAPYVKDRHDNP